jgi:hypothetical protein
MNTPNEDRDLFQSDSFDPFPQPQTIPTGWDLSVLFPPPAPESLEAADELAGDESSLGGQVDK